MSTPIEQAAWHLRVLAVLVDLILLSLLFLPFAIITVVLMLLAGLTAERLGDFMSMAGIGYLGGCLGYFVYFTSRNGERNGQTPGKQLMGIKVVRNDGRLVGKGYALVREILIKPGILVIGSNIFFIPVIIDILWPLFDSQKRALHDLPMNSQVIRCGPSYFERAGV